MNYIEKLHLDVLDENTIHHQEVPNDLDTIKSAQKSAEITEQIAIEFLDFIGDNDSLFEKWATNKKSSKELFQEFLKQNNE